MRLLLALLLACPPAVAQELGKLADHLEASSEYSPPPELASRLKTRSEALAATYEVLASQQGCEQDFEVEPLAPADYNAERLRLRDLPEGCERAQVLTRLSRFNKEGKVPLTNAGLSNVEGVCAAYCDGYGGDYSGSPGYGLGYELGKLMGQGLIAMFGLLAQGIAELGKDRPKTPRAPKTAKAPAPPKPKPEPEKPKVKLTLKVDAPEKAEVGQTFTVTAVLSASRSDYPVAGQTIRFEAAGKKAEAITDASGRARISIEIMPPQPPPAENPTAGDPIAASHAVALQPQTLQSLSLAMSAGGTLLLTVSAPALITTATLVVVAASAVTVGVLIWEREEEKTRNNAEGAHAALNLAVAQETAGEREEEAALEQEVENREHNNISIHIQPLGKNTQGRDNWVAGREGSKVNRPMALALLQQVNQEAYDKFKNRPPLVTALNRATARARDFLSPAYPIVNPRPVTYEFGAGNDWFRLDIEIYGKYPYQGAR